MIIRGRVLAAYGDNIATEVMVASKHVKSLEPIEMAKVCMRDIDPDFYDKMHLGGILIAGSNFGCSSSREWAPVALKAANVKVVIAKSFARIFYRNALNIGLPIVECDQVGTGINEGDELDVDLRAGLIKNLGNGQSYGVNCIPDFLLDQLDRGGLIAVLRGG